MLRPRSVSAGRAEAPRDPETSCPEEGVAAVLPPPRHAPWRPPGPAPRLRRASQYSFDSRIASPGHVRAPSAAMVSLSSQERCRGPTRIPRSVGKGQCLVILETSLRGRIAGRKRQVGKALEVGEGCVAPPSSLLFLDAQKRRDLTVPFRIHVGRKRGPGAAHLMYIVDAARIVDHELIP